MLISIREFATTGNFGPIRIGMHKSEVMKLLGTPEGLADFGRGSSGLLYGGYEFFFEDEKLTAIQNDRVDFLYPETVYFENEQFKIDPWILDGNRGTTMEEILALFLEEGVECDAVEYFGRSALQFGSGVVIDFDEADEGGTLIGFRYFPETDGA